MHVEKPGRGAPHLLDDLDPTERYLRGTDMKRKEFPKTGGSKVREDPPVRHPPPPANWRSKNDPIHGGNAGPVERDDEDDEDGDASY